MPTRPALGLFALGLALSGLMAPAAPATAAETCFGLTPTHVGTPGNDTFIGTDRLDVFITGAGNDVVHGLAGNDAICLGPGNDQGWGEEGTNYFDPGTGDDQIFGNATTRTDRLSYSTSTRPVVVNLETGVATGQGTDDLNFIDFVYGSPFGDTMIGNSRANLFHGDGGNDILQGADGNDSLYGDAGDDSLDGGPGFDRCYGGDGHNRISLTCELPTLP